MKVSLFMENKVCCSFGHREVYENVSARLDRILEDLIINKGVRTFLTGGMGRFDEIFSNAVRRKKVVCPQTELVLVCPYLTQELNRNKEWYEQNFDSILIPSVLVGVHYKSAIQARNRWLADHSDYVVAYVKRPFGGAYDAVRYSEKQEKRIYSVAEGVV